MRKNEPVGIKIFAILGILYGFLLLAFSALFYVPMTKHFFINLLKIQPHRLYITSFIYFALAIAFIFSGQALIKRKLWARNLFLLSIVLNLLLETYNLLKEIVNNINLKIQLFNLGSIVEFLFIFTLSTIMLWYFNRKTIKKYLGLITDNYDNKAL